jgi:hypothetical protein
MLIKKFFGDTPNPQGLSVFLFYPFFLCAASGQYHLKKPQKREGGKLPLYMAGKLEASSSFPAPHSTSPTGWSPKLAFGFPST